MYFNDIKKYTESYILDNNTNAGQLKDNNIVCYQTVIVLQLDLVQAFHPFPITKYYSPQRHKKLLFKKKL